MFKFRASLGILRVFLFQFSNLQGNNFLGHPAAETVIRHPKIKVTIRIDYIFKFEYFIKLKEMHRNYVHIFFSWSFWKCIKIFWISLYLSHWNILSVESSSAVVFIRISSNNSALEQITILGKLVLNMYLFKITFEWRCLEEQQKVKFLENYKALTFTKLYQYDNSRASPKNK